MAVTSSVFGTTKDGKTITAYTMTNRKGASCTVIDYGAAVTGLRVPASDGSLVDVIPACADLQGYEEGEDRLCALVGRNANRIAGAAFSIDGVSYSMPANDGTNNLHSWPAGLEHKVFVLTDQVSSPEGDSLTFAVSSPDGDAGMPGNLDLTAVFAWTEDDRLDITLRAVTDKATVCNPTSHLYLNLNGEGEETALTHQMQIFADAYVPIRPGGIPYGKEAPVAGTPFDFTAPKAIGADIGREDEQLACGSGYDHSFSVNGEAGTLRQSVRLTGDRSGIVLDLYQTSPGLQVYTANFLDLKKGKNGHSYGPRSCVALEPQFHPNAVNEPSFGSPILRPGETFVSVISLRFGTL